MKNRKSFVLVMFAAFIFVCLQTVALAQGPNDSLANVNGGGSLARWDVVVPNAGGTLTISAPDGRIFTREFKAGGSPDFSLTDKQLERLPDGQYTYELRLRPVMSSSAREAIKAARGKDDDPEAERAARKRPAVAPLVQSGGFSILNGSIVVGGAPEDPRRSAKTTGVQRTGAVFSGNTVTRLRNHRVFLGAIPDDVIPDDLIVQGSACVGLDCVNGEVFGFDTIRMKENNTRLQFEDTSAAGFPLNNWQIRANSSAAGGASFLAFVDQGAAGNSETGTIVFEVDAGAPANSLKVSSNGKVGLRTATPVLDVHANTSDTPAIRLEQNNSGGFTAQTWDMAGNEANFFVRDVTGGSRLPFRIRPGAPTSSIDISADGNVGIGTASPAVRLHSQITSANVAQPAVGADIGLFIGNTDTTANNFEVLSFGNAANAGQGQIGVINIGSTATAGGHMFFTTRAAGASVAERMRITSAGNVGIGTTAPDQKLSVNGDASKTGGNTWLAFSDERLKTIKGRFNTGLKAVMQLQPIRYEYLKNNALGLKSEGEHIGFGAQTLQKIIPEAVTKNADGYLMVNSDPIIWTMLNAIKEQQKEIAELKAEVQKMRAASHRRRK
ncbi:MAG: tail fiber domain-containing protein [Acidobacteriota bacterium]